MKERGRSGFRVVRCVDTPYTPFRFSPPESHRFCAATIHVPQRKLTAQAFTSPSEPRTRFFDVDFRVHLMLLPRLLDLDGRAQSDYAQRIQSRTLWSYP